LALHRKRIYKSPIGSKASVLTIRILYSMGFLASKEVNHIRQSEKILGGVVVLFSNQDLSGYRDLSSFWRVIFSVHKGHSRLC
jgi:hypothetical protein